LLDSRKIKEIKYCTDVYKQKNVLSVVTAIVNHACIHTSSIAACMVACIEADNRAVNTCTKKSITFLLLVMTHCTIAKLLVVI